MEATGEVPENSESVVPCRPGLVPLVQFLGCEPIIGIVRAGGDPQILGQRIERDGEMSQFEKKSDIRVEFQTNFFEKGLVCELFEKNFLPVGEVFRIHCQYPVDPAIGLRLLYTMSACENSDLMLPDFQGIRDIPARQFVAARMIGREAI